MRSLTEAYGDVNQKTTLFKYNSFGQKSEMIKPNGIVLKYDYDEFGRLKSLNSSDGSISYLYEYNLNNAVTTVTDLATQDKTERHFDPFGQLNYEIQSNGLRTDYAYDKSGRVRFVYLPDETGIEYIYDAVDLKEVYRLKNGQRIYGHLNQSHDLTGQITQAKLAGKNGELQYSYDQLGRCVNIFSPHFQQVIPQNGFDARGNLRTSYVQNNPYQFDYDDLNQLISEKGHFEHTYRFDSLANRKNKDGEEHIHNALHQLIQKGDDHFEYDKNGNLIKHTLSEKIIHYEYDALDRLISISQDDEKIHYVYDGFNRRLAKKQVGKEDQLFLYLAQEELGKFVAGRLTEFRLLTKNKRSPMVAMELQDKLYVPIYDISGNVVCLTDEQGDIVEKYRYTVFGECEILNSEDELLQTSRAGNPWQYSGKRLDYESGLIAFGLRYYDSRLGRWITPDPAGFEDGPNLYAYVHNSPLLHFDQFGQFDLLPLYQAYSFHSSLFGETAFQCNYEKYLAASSIINPFSFGLPFYGFSKSFNEKAGIYDINSTKILNQETNQPFVFRQTNNYFGFANGILNDRPRGFRKYITSKLANHNMIGVHSPTFGITNDGIRYGLARAGVASETAGEIIKCWSECFKENRNAYICWTCHSRGVVEREIH